MSTLHPIMSAADALMAPLPEPDHSLDCGTLPFYSADQMHAYAREYAASLAVPVPATKEPGFEVNRNQDGALV